jgi:N6-adenosine-specific RNA methylase IME4
VNNYTQEKDIGSIKVEARYREDLGDIEGLAQSINQVGLLHPIVITADGRLIAGQRRLEACKSLGWSKIPVTIIDLKDILRGQTDENTLRKDLTPSEAVAIAMVIEPEVKKEASQHQTVQAGGKLEPPGGKLPPGTGKTRDKLARLVGMSGRTLEKATGVVNAAREDPEKYGHLVKQMDAKGKVDGAFRELERLQNRNSMVTTARGLAEEASFDVILAIPPWIEGRQENDTVADIEPSQVMSVKDMKKLKLPIVADAVLFLQTPPRKLPSALELLAAWCFEYKTFQVWSYLNRASSGLVAEIHHVVLIGVKGNHPASVLENLAPSITPVKPLLVLKPLTIYDCIEKVFPAGKYLEVFSRSNRQGWTSWPTIAECDKGLEKTTSREHRLIGAHGQYM